jgi:hypothetical protein
LFAVVLIEARPHHERLLSPGSPQSCQFLWVSPNIPLVRIPRYCSDGARCDAYNRVLLESRRSLRKGICICSSNTRSLYHDRGTLVGNMLLLSARIAIGCDRFIGSYNHIHHYVARADGYLTRGHHLFSQRQCDWRNEIGGEMYEKRKRGPGRDAEGDPSPISGGNCITYQRGASGERGQKRAPSIRRGIGHSSPFRVRVARGIGRKPRLVTWSARSRGKCDARGINLVLDHHTVGIEWTRLTWD